MSKQNPFLRWARHFWMDQGHARRQLSPAGLRQLEERVRASEARHTGELRLCVEGGLHWQALWQGQTARTRALDMFSALRVWDTEHNNGVLIYLLLADHHIEILADRGIMNRVAPQAWSAIAKHLSATLRAGQFEQGLNEAVDAVTDLLVTHFPADAAVGHPNELPDQVVVI
ncbi:MAG: TPM domain-containing protein [Burkholderiales bacterium]|nr:TPM domain-containing protein [Burkholderiales bacterium]